MKKITKLLLKNAAAVLSASMFFPGTATAQTFCNNQTGTDDGFYYTHWTAGRGSACMTLGNGGRYSYSWSNVGNHVGGKGWRPGSTNRVIGYNAERYSPSGKSLLALYGWTQNPLIEYYVVDNWGGNRPSKGSALGRVETDGGVYDIYRTQRVNKPSIEGTRTFYQYWSVRTSKRSTGQNHTITFRNHADAWRAAGLNLGSHFYQVLATEGLRDSSGESRIRVWDQGSSTPQPTPTPEPGGYNGRVDLPGTVEAENYYKAPVESTANNRNSRPITQCTYYGLGVDVQDSSEGSCNVGWTTSGEELEYRIDDAGGNFDIKVRLASRDSGKRVRVLVNGNNVGTVTSSGGGWSAWDTKTITNVSVPSNATIKVVFPDGGVNLNYLEFVRPSGPVPTPQPTPTATPAPTSTPVPTQTPTPPTSGCGQTLNVEWRARSELTVDNSICIRFDRNLSGNTLQVWDSDTNTSCNYRGTITSVDGSGSLSVSSNYVSSGSLSGTTFKFNGGSCRYVKVRAF